MKIQNNPFDNASLNRQGLTAETDQVTPQSDTPEGGSQYNAYQDALMDAGHISLRQ
jgi:hypothetical protein